MFFQLEITIVHPIISQWVPLETLFSHSSEDLRELLELSPANRSKKFIPIDKPNQHIPALNTTPTKNNEWSSDDNVQ